MVTFYQYLQENNHSFDFSSETAKQKKVRIRRALQTKIDSFEITPTDPVTTENMQSICESLNLDDTMAKEAIDMSQHLIDTSKYREEITKHFGNKISAGRSPKGSDFRKIAQLLARFGPQSDAKTSPSTKLIEDIMKDKHIEKYAIDIASKGIQQKTLLTQLYDGVAWVGDKIKSFFQFIWGGLESMRQYAKEHPSHAAMVLMLCLSVLCYIKQTCKSVIQDTWVCVYDYTSRQAEWVWNFIKAFFGQNDKFVYSINDKEFESTYQRERTKQLSDTCSDYLPTQVVETGADAVSNFFGYGNIGSALASLVKTTLCKAGGYGAVKVFGGEEYDTVAYTAIRKAALVDERQKLQQLYASMFTVILPIITTFASLKEKTVEKYWNMVQKIASAGREFKKVEADMYNKMSKEVDKRMGLKTELRFMLKY